MSEVNLTPEQKAVLQALVDSAQPAGVYRHRAEILLAYDEGLLTAEISRRLQISPRLARYWKQTFQKKGMAIFSEAGPAVPSEISGANLSETVADEVEEPEESSGAQDQSTEPKKSKASKGPGILAHDDTHIAGIRLFHYLFIQMLDNEEGTRLGEDIEALHDMRVATRRLRAAFEVFAPYFPEKTLKPFRKDTREVGRALGSVRDLDVFIEKTQAAILEPGAPSPESVAPLLAYYQAQRDELRRTLVDLLDGSNYRQFVHDFQEFLEHAEAHSHEPTGWAVRPHRIDQIVPILVYTRLADVRTFDDGLENASLERLHALRTAFKYFRYTLEFFREVLGEEVRQSIEELKRIQDHLGDLNDANVACGLINTFLSAWDLRQDVQPLAERQNPEGVIACLSARSKERHRLLTEFPQAWAQFNHPEFRQLIARTVSAL